VNRPHLATSLRYAMYDTTAVLPKIQHSNCCKRVPNRPLRPHRGRFGTTLGQLQCGIFQRTAVCGNCVLMPWQPWIFLERYVFMCMCCSPTLCHLALCLSSSLSAEASDCHARCQFCHPLKRNVRVEQCISLEHC